MAKAKRSAANQTAPKVRKWPDRADLKPWLECYLDVSEQHPDEVRASILACVPLRQFADCGYATAALKRLQRLLDKLPPSECEATGFLALVGAEICLDLPDLRRAEKYLQLTEARLATAVPRVRDAFQIRLRKRRAMNGLSESSASSFTGKDAIAYQFGQYRKEYRTALLADDMKTAAKALQKAAKLLPKVDDFLMKPGLILSILTAFRRLDDQVALTKYVTWLDRNGHSRNLASGSLWGMGLTEIASKRAVNVIVNHLKKLKRDADPNIHFPVNEICKELWFFLQTGQKELATKMLRRILRELPQWPGVRSGFATSAVLTELAEVLAEIDGPEAALELLGLSLQAGQAERHRGFRQSALNAANRQIEAPGLSTAIARANTIKNAKARREALLPLLTKRADWSGLATILKEITDVDELMSALHSVLFALPGGSRLM